MPSDLLLRFSLVSLLVFAPTIPGSLTAQTFRSDDPVLRQMWELGMERSQVEPLAQVLTDSIGPRLSGSPGFDAAADWLLGMHEAWGGGSPPGGVRKLERLESRGAARGPHLAPRADAGSVTPGLEPRD
jgi:hypothetical protein